MKNQSVVEMQIINNQLDGERTPVSLRYAMQEIENLMRKEWIIIPIGFILRTHGLIFEKGKHDWILRPRNWLHHAEITKRYPEKCQRRRFYKLRYGQKRNLPWV